VVEEQHAGGNGTTVPDYKQREQQEHGYEAMLSDFVFDHGKDPLLG
jgi:hypothetical protein